MGLIVVKKIAKKSEKLLKPKNLSKFEKLFKSKKLTKLKKKLSKIENSSKFYIKKTRVSFLISNIRTTFNYL